MGLLIHHAHHDNLFHLDMAVLKNRGFRAANPGCVKGSPRVYVGATEIALAHERRQDGFAVWQN